MALRLKTLWYMRSRYDRILKGTAEKISDGGPGLCPLAHFGPSRRQTCMDSSQLGHLTSIHLTALTLDHFDWKTENRISWRLIPLDQPKSLICQIYR
jgi:hypothetical protein